MSTNISRRSIAKGAAWATPAVLATSVVPAYAASTEPTTPNSYRFGRQGKASYFEQHDGYGTCIENEAVFTTANLNALPWASGHGVVYFKDQGVDTTATLNSYTIRVAYPKNTTSGNWNIDNPNWSVRKVSVQTFASTSNIGNESFYVGDRDVYEFTFNGPKTAPVYELGAANNEWPEGAFTAVDNTPIDYCAIKSDDMVYYIEFAWDFTTANGYANKSVAATQGK